MSRIILSFTRDELMYDIRSTAYVMADAMEEGSAAARLLRDIGEDGNKDRVTRMINLETARCTEEMYAYTKQEADDMELRDNILKEEDTYTIELKAEGFSKTTAELLEALIHEYIVTKVLTEWLRLTDAAGADTRRNELLVNAAGIMTEIQKALNRRTHVLKTRMNFP